MEFEYIEKRTGIKERYYAKEEGIEQIALEAVRDLQGKVDISGIGLIITATTTTNLLMPGISNYIQKELNLKKCICLDILAGCGGYINAFDIASMYIKCGKVSKALVIGVDILSKYTNINDVGTKIILSDGAGCTLLSKSKEEKLYESCIESEGNKNDILTCKTDEKIYMDGKAVYKYAVTRTVQNINHLLKKSKVSIEDISYIVPHQSNIKIINAIASRLKIDSNKMYTNIQKIGNTFCASIPICLSQMYEQNLLKKGDKIILLGYGGGLNTASILIEV